jgi:predicted dehydrogenase
MIDRKIRVGVIGTGQIGKHHLSRYQEISDAEVVAVADVNADVARDAAKQFGVGDVYSDFRELLRRDDVDSVDVCLHNNYHMPVTAAALEAGKHVFCEKPMAGSYRDAKAMLQAARRTGKRLAIQLDTLFDLEVRVAKQLIDEGRLGALYFARSTGFRRRNRPYVDGYGSQAFVQKKTAAGGALYDMGVYHISAVLHLLGNPRVARVSGKTYQKTAMDEQRRQASGYGVEELGLGLVRFAGDLTLDLIESWAIHLDGFESSYVVGTEAGIRLSPFGFFQNWGDLEVTSTINLERAQQRWKDLRGEADEYKKSQHHWIAALRGKVEQIPSDEIALNTMLISEAIYLSDRLGREVSAQEVEEGSVSTAVQV